MDSSDETLINPEELAGELARHLPEQQSSAAELLKKSALYRATQSEQPAKEAALDWIDIGNITFLINQHKALTLSILTHGRD